MEMLICRPVMNPNSLIGLNFGMNVGAMWLVVVHSVQTVSEM
jgi:hypothetical protein